MKSMLMSLNLPQALQRVEPSGRIFESLRVSSQAEKLTRPKKLGESVARKTHLSTGWRGLTPSSAGKTGLKAQGFQAGSSRFIAKPAAKKHHNG
jgi:hypothetical protein